MFKIFPKRQAEGKKPSFDEWIKKATDLLEEYIDEPGLEPLEKAREKMKKISPNTADLSKKKAIA